MRITCITVLLLLLLCGQGLAIAPVTAATITSALEYGKSRANLSLDDFFVPWTVYEEKAQKLNESTERVYVYTPFLLLASDARDRTLARQPVRFGDSEKILSEYNGYVIVGVTLFGRDPNFADKLTATLRQGKKSFEVHTVNLPAEAAKTPWHGGREPGYMTQGYLYFWGKDIDPLKPASLTISTGDKRKRSFYLDLGNFR
ncbi:MAG TPA: hypothetical protein PKA10_06925 [Selenomonadales bacterium]|nr:hypothetical protein [Selenomonadales bacterium]